MWKDPRGKLDEFIQTNSTLQIESLVIAEWNMNSFLTINNYGTYRNIPSDETSKYYRLPINYDPLDQGDYYTDANKSYFTFSDFIDENDQPVLFESENVNRSLYYDLKSCFQPFRPRSGINKPLVLNTYIDNIRSARSPRYYMASRYDNFKYWNSYTNNFTDSRPSLEYSVVAKAMTSGSATLALSNASHQLKVNDSINIFSVDDNFNGGNLIITAVTSASISYVSLSASTIASASATGYVRLNRKIEEFGVSNITNPTGFNDSIGYFISNAAPFVVYKERAPINRIVVKMQTNMADVGAATSIQDRSGIIITNPFSDINQSSIPKRWRIEYLDTSDNWVTAIKFNENSLRSDGTNIVPWDGHVEVSYGIKFPTEFRDCFTLISNLTSTDFLPVSGNRRGDAYIVGEGNGNLGTLYIWDSLIPGYINIPVEYGFMLVETDDTKRTGIITQLTDPKYVIQSIASANKIVYKEIIFIKGLRVVVDTMYASEKTFDLIELSPRLRADISSYSMGFNVNKNIANDSTGLPVGGLMATTGDISLFNYDGSFTENNILCSSDGVFLLNDDDPKKQIADVNITPVHGSLVSQYLKTNVKFDLYEAILNVDGYDKFIPIKTLYSEVFPSSGGGESQIQVTLRDLFFRLETTRSTPLFLTNITLTAAVAILLDSIGFSNYIFIGFEDRVESGDEFKFKTSLQDPEIPFFFIQPDVAISQVLIDLATSFQAAMFFDEYNNFVIMPKEYLLPKAGYRDTNMTLYGNPSVNSNYKIALPNIINIDANETKVLNDGVIQYSTRYIQREISALQQARFTDQDKTYNYKPVLLWEVAGNQDTKTVNQSQTTSQNAALSAVPLNQTLSSNIPSVVNGSIINNTMNFGENVMWIGKFQGYFYANGEIIRYDAVEYNIPNASASANTAWISNNQEYQKYFRSLEFGGKIYPTGNVRIYTEPTYSTINGNVTITGISKHGRGQFNTQIVEHPAGLAPYWSSDDNVICCKMEDVSKYLFSTTPTEKISYPTEGNTTTRVGTGAKELELVKGSSRNGIIKNFLRSTFPTDDVIRKLQSTQSATIQSSALVFSGAQTVSSSATALPIEYPKDSNKRDYIFYVHKELTSEFKHVGSRVRILGSKKVGESFQLPRGSFEYFSVTPEGASDKVSIQGGSVGIGISTDKATNLGYYFEITSLTSENLGGYQKTNQSTGELVSVLHNVNFYKIVNSGGKAIPKKLYGELGQILVDEGLFVGMDRVGTDATPTVYDLAIEYENIGSSRRFYLYINNKNIAIVDDKNPLPERNNMCLFVRGSSEAMFENVYALQSLISKNIGETVANQVSEAFGIDQIATIQALRQYGMAGFIQASYLSNVSAGSQNNFKIYYDEFGTIMRECAYFNIRYDKAYPALIAELVPISNGERGYTVSAFKAGSYGAEFLIFNNTDKTITLDEKTGNFLRIMGVTFTQNTSYELSVDDYFKERANFSDPLVINGVIQPPEIAEQTYNTIKTSRQRNGKREFSINPLFIQNEEMASELMEWFVDKTLRERKSFTMTVFGVPQLQLGDIVNIDFTMPEGVAFVDKTKQFVVSSINYARSMESLEASIKVIEV